MPRRARLDAPGCVHHVTARGIEKREIFRDDRDRARFIDILEEVLADCAGACLAWALMPNHFHLILRTTEQPLSRIMARLNTAYAVNFNLRHERAGHLFQNRFHSKPIEDDVYLRVAICYVHRNPLRAGTVRSLAELESHEWTGHAALMGHRVPLFLAVSRVLELFGADRAEARANLREWMQEDGSSAESDSMRPSVVDVIDKGCRLLAVSKADLLGRSRDRRACAARSVIAHLACDCEGYSQTVVARALGVGVSSIHRARQRGKAVLSNLADFPRKAKSRNVP